MNKFLKISAVAAILSLASVSAAVSNDFSANRYTTTVIVDDFDFSLEATDNGADRLEVGVTLFDHNLGAAQSNLRFYFGTDLKSAGDDLYVGVDYNTVYAVSDGLSVYGTVGLLYDADSKLAKDAIYFVPTVGAAYNISPVVGVFGEVGYSWDVDGWAKEGGYVEIGMPVLIADNVTLTPSLVRTFDTPGVSDDINLNIGLAFKF